MMRIIVFWSLHWCPPYNRKLPHISSPHGFALDLFEECHGYHGSVWHFDKLYILDPTPADLRNPYEMLEQDQAAFALCVFGVDF